MGTNIKFKSYQAYSTSSIGGPLSKAGLDIRECL